MDSHTFSSNFYSKVFHGYIHLDSRKKEEAETRRRLAEEKRRHEEELEKEKR